ncbi:phosphopantetheine-binding protein [Kibdelosporangium philippinense]|uniref:Phosphopantetheine-binding protein n=1 Tax=Kibdelosporangium philippinense TaxID=211113 RepID=A0ABS8Z5P6_9PSEU|nr:phosphopantetheine-binding protein [Kibdelosporangium philippinense]MCE7003216.1 phosphopantetheine-binding protein [Kibdelosporangium philippinense]
MTTTHTVEAIRAALTEVLNRDLPELDQTTRLFEDLHLDSTSVLELLMALEDALDIEVDPDELRAEDFTTVESLAEYVRRLSGN